MAQMPIEIVKISKQYTFDLHSALDAADSLQSAFSYSEVKADADLMLMNLGRAVTTEIFDGIDKYRRRARGYHPFIIAVIDSHLESERLFNLFGSHRAEDGLAIISTANVENLIIPEGKMVSYFLYYLARYTLSFIAPAHKSHDEHRNCVFDRKIHKPDLLQSIKSRSICDICRRELLSNQIMMSSEQFDALSKLFDAAGSLLGDVQNDERSKSNVFIASSFEGLEVAREVQSELAHDYTVVIWNQGGTFGLGQVNIEALEKAVMSYDFGIFIFTPDDELHSKGEFKKVARDNVVFELGLFVGRLSRFRAFVIHPSKRTIELPSDLSGMTMATYDPDAENLRAALGPACQKIRRAIGEAPDIK